MKVLEHYEKLTHAVLIVGYKFEWDQLAADGESMDALTEAVPGLDLVVCADLENTTAEDIEYSPMVYGKKLFTSFGGPEQERGFEWEELRTMIAEATVQLEEAVDVVAEHFDELPEIGVHLACCGWLASAWCIKGVWDESIDFDKITAHEGGHFGARDALYLYQGTDGASQEDYPNGGVKGVWVGGDSFDGTACANLELSDDTDAALDDILASAGVTEPRYFFIAAYD